MDIYSVIRSMHKAECGAVILGAGHALPADKSIGNLRDVVRSLYQDETITAQDILDEYEEANH